MSVKNVNLISQNGNEILEKEKEQYIQALANMGQRVGIKGDSVENGSFNFLDCFSKKLSNTITTSKHIGYIKYIDDPDSSNIYNKKCIFGIVEKEDEKYSPKELYPSINDSSVVEYEVLDNKLLNSMILDKNFELDVRINNIFTYNKKSILKRDSDYLYTLLVGEIPSDDYDNDFNVELQYNKFSVKDNLLVYGLRLFHFNNYEQPVYCLLEIDNTHSMVDYPVLRVYKFDTSLYLTNNISPDQIDIINSYFCLDNYNNELISKNSLVNLLNSIQNRDNDEYAYLNDIFNIILEKEAIGDYKRYQIGNDIILYYDINETKFIFDQESYQSYINKSTFNKDKYDISLLDRLGFINNDIVYLYPALLKEYNNYFSDNINTMYKKVLLSLFDKLISNFENNELPELIKYDANEYIMFIPLDYEIKYFVNSNNPFGIYYIHDLFVNIINATIYTYEDDFDDKIFNSVCFSSNKVSINKTINMKLNVNYNTSFDNVINGISSVIDYTLPYIDPVSYNWVLNETRSGICSYINKYDKQYIVIILSGLYSNNTIDGYVLNNLPSEFDIIGYKPQKFSFNPYTLVGSQLNIKDNELESEIFGYTALPVVNSDKKYILNNSIIVSITDQRNIDDVNIQNSNELSFCTLWKYDALSDDYQIIKDPNTENPFDLSKLLNLDVAISRYKNTTNYIYEYIGLLLDERKLHSNYSNGNMVFLLYSENNENKLEILPKFINNHIDISKNEILNKDNGQVATKKDLISLNNKENNKFINFKKSNISDNYVLRKNIYLNENNKSDNDILIEDIQSTVKTEIINKVLADNTDYQYMATGFQGVMLEDVSTANNINSTTVINKVIGTNGDYKFNINVPVIDNSEVLSSNNNLLNRINILTLNKENSNNIIYNTIIGSEISNDGKSTFVIRPSNENINLGTKTLINESDRDKFAKQDRLKIEFENIEINTNNIKVTTLYNEEAHVGEDIINTRRFSLYGNGLYIDLSDDNNSDNSYIIEDYLLDEDKKFDMMNRLDYQLNNLMIEYKINHNQDIYYGFNLYKYFVMNNIDLEEYEKLYNIIKGYDNSSNFDIIFNQALSVNDCFVKYSNNEEYPYIFIFINKDHLHKILSESSNIYKADIVLELIRIKNTSSNNVKYMFHFMNGEQTEVASIKDKTESYLERIIALETHVNTIAGVIKSYLNSIYDVNGDNKIDISDMVRLMNVISNNQYDYRADINKDGRVDVSDIVKFNNATSYTYTKI